MKKNESKTTPFYHFGSDFDNHISGNTSFDPLGSYTGRTPDLDEVPVQDADDL